RDRPLQRLFRRLGPRQRRRRPSRRRGYGAGGRQRSLLAGLEREHPDAWRHGLHLGAGLPPLLSARQPPRPADRQPSRLEGKADRAPRDAQRRLNRQETQMDFNDTPEEAAFRKEVRAFLDSAAERKTPEKHSFAVPYGADNLVPIAKEFQRRKAEAGMAGITWPVEYGGRGMPQIHQVIYNQEEADYLVPRGVFE